MIDMYVKASLGNILKICKREGEGRNKHGKNIQYKIQFNYSVIMPSRWVSCGDLGAPLNRPRKRFFFARPTFEPKYIYPKITHESSQKTPHLLNKHQVIAKISKEIAKNDRQNEKLQYNTGF